MLLHQQIVRLAQQDNKKALEKGTMCRLCGQFSNTILWQPCPDGRSECLHLRATRTNGGICKMIIEDQMFERCGSPRRHFDQRFQMFLETPSAKYYWDGEAVFSFLCGSCMGEVLYPISVQEDERAKEFTFQATRLEKLLDRERFLSHQATMHARSLELKPSANMTEYLERELKSEKEGLAETQELLKEMSYLR